MNKYLSGLKQFYCLLTAMAWSILVVLVSRKLCHFVFVHLVVEKQVRTGNVE
jgi:hypothetical protein